MTVSSAPGTGSSIGLGSAVAGHLSFAQGGISNGDVITYAIRDGSNSEIGTATYSTTGPSLSGRTVTNSTNSNAAINATASAEVFITASADDIANTTTATKLATSRTIALAGDVIGSVGFDGSANVSITTTASGKANVASPTFTGIASFGTSPTLAAAGTTQGTATAIVNTVSIVTSGTGGVVLPASLPVGTELKVINATGSAIDVYPNSGAAIGPLATNAAFSLPAGTYLTFACGSSTKWFPPAAVYA